MSNQPHITPNNPELSVVVPVYKEETNIQPFLQRMEAALKGLGANL